MRVLIIGGTSGIGLALALHYAEQGDTVGVCGRNAERVPPETRMRYPALQIHAVDVVDKATLGMIMRQFAIEGLDLVFVCAGFYFNTRHHAQDPATTLRMLQTNVSGTAHAFELAAEVMLPQGTGHIVAIASIAGLLKDYPGASLYSATKRTVLQLCDTYRLALQPFSIAVTAIVPGYVDTLKLRALNHGDASHKPFLVSEARAVQEIMGAVQARCAVHVFPRRMHALVSVLNFLPRWLMRLRP